MRLIIGPDEVYEDADDLDIQEFREVKRVTGLGLKEWTAAIREYDPDALAALVWVLRRRSDPNLSLRDVHFRLSDLDWEDPDNVDDPGKDPSLTSSTPGTPGSSSALG